MGVPLVEETAEARRARLAELLNVLHEAKTGQPPISPAGFLTIQAAIIRLEVELNWRSPEDREESRTSANRPPVEGKALNGQK